MVVRQIKHRALKKRKMLISALMALFKQLKVLTFKKVMIKKWCLPNDMENKGTCIIIFQQG